MVRAMTVQRGFGSEARVPAALGVSIALHAAGLAAFLAFTEKASREGVRVITDVELLIEQERKGQPLPAAARPPAPSMSDFLKLALPAIPRASAPLEVKAPELERKLMDIPQPKLEDRGRMAAGPKLEGLDLGRRRMDVAKVAAPLVERDSRLMASLPALEEVGTRQAAKKVLEMAALAEERRGRLAGPQLGSMDVKLERRQAPSMAAPLLAEAAPQQGSSPLERLAAALPSKTQTIQFEAKPDEGRLKRMQSMEAPALPAPERRTEVQKASPKKGVEIEGPLSARRLLEGSLPAFPAWLKDLGVVDADVSVRIFVSPAGLVLEDRMRVERTSGYGRLDRLAMDHLKKWRFDPLRLDDPRTEWGVITFRFILE
jgi:protein TonB